MWNKSKLHTTKVWGQYNFLGKISARAQGNLTNSDSKKIYIVTKEKNILNKTYRDESLDQYIFKNMKNIV